MSDALGGFGMGEVLFIMAVVGCLFYSARNGRPRWVQSLVQSVGWSIRVPLSNVTAGSRSLMAWSRGAAA